MIRNTITVFSMLLLVALIFSACKKEEGDQNPPFIIMNPPNPQVWAQDLPYVDPGAVAYDVTESGDTVDITDRLSAVDNVNVAVTGEYEVRYNVSDAAGNNAEEQVRTVRVVITK